MREVMSFEIAMTGLPNQLLEQIAKYTQRLAVNKLPEDVRTTIAAAQSLFKRFEGATRGLAERYDPELFSWLKVAASAATYYQRNIPNWHQTAEKLADDSWFIGPCIAVSDCLTLVDTAYQFPEMVDDAFMRFYSDEIDNLSDELCGYFPARAGVIRAAVDAHKAGNYALSIPVFFSQTDGFCYDVNRSLFDGKGNDLRAVKADPTKRIHIKHDAQHLSKQREEVGMGGFFLPILGKIPNIALGELQRKKVGYHGLNRNSVLHGEDAQYGTEINSLKAFSFMVFIAGFVHAYQEEMGDLNRIATITGGS